MNKGDVLGVLAADQPVSDVWWFQLMLALLTALGTLAAVYIGAVLALRHRDHERSRQREAIAAERLILPITRAGNVLLSFILDAEWDSLPDGLSMADLAERFHKAFAEFEAIASESAFLRDRALDQAIRDALYGGDMFVFMATYDTPPIRNGAKGRQRVKEIFEIAGCLGAVVRGDPYVIPKVTGMALESDENSEG